MGQDNAIEILYDSSEEKLLGIRRHVNNFNAKVIDPHLVQPSISVINCNINN